MLFFRDKGYKNTIVANEIRQEEYQNLINSGADFIYQKDFLTEKLPNHDVKTIITNPPFSTAKEFILQVQSEKAHAGRSPSLDMG